MYEDLPVARPTPWTSSLTSRRLQLLSPLRRFLGLAPGVIELDQPLEGVPQPHVPVLRRELGLGPSYPVVPVEQKGFGVGICPLPHKGAAEQRPRVVRVRGVPRLLLADRQAFAQQRLGRGIRLRVQEPAAVVGQRGRQFRAVGGQRLARLPYTLRRQGGRLRGLPGPHVSRQQYTADPRRVGVLAALAADCFDQRDALGNSS